MQKVTRRGFIGGITAVAAAVGAAVAVPKLLAKTSEAEAQSAAGNITLNAAQDGELDGVLVAQVRSVASGEISLFVGTQEITFTDKELVRQFLTRVGVAS